MRTSSETGLINAQAPTPLMDERLETWQPERISDRKLLELRTRLEKINRLGDAFADVALSAPLQARLRKLNPPASPPGFGK